jgi:MoaA/NifB/PqqE/SkfB family radical SAM enzyme
VACVARSLELLKSQRSQRRPARLLEQLDIVLWSVFFLVPTGRGSRIGLISGGEFEQVFEKLYETSRRVKFDIQSTEVRRVVRYLFDHFPYRLA